MWYIIEEGVGVIDYRGGSWCDRVEEGVGVIECRGVSWRDRL